MPKQQTDASRRRNLGPVSQFLRRVSEPLVRDDLLLRVMSFLSGILFGGFGVAMFVGGIRDDFGTRLFVQFVYFAIATLFMGYGGLMLLRCVLSARSRMARFLERFLPDTAGLEEGVLLILLIYLPAVLLTLLLRFFGIKGQSSDWDRGLR